MKKRACYLFLCVAVAAAAVFVRACACVCGGKWRGGEGEGERDGPPHVQATWSICLPFWQNFIFLGLCTNSNLANLQTACMVGVVKEVPRKGEETDTWERRKEKVKEERK